jgi:hypothetical protein
LGGPRGPHFCPFLPISGHFLILFTPDFKNLKQKNKKMGVSVGPFLPIFCHFGTLFYFFYTRFKKAYLKIRMKNENEIKFWSAAPLFAHFFRFLNIIFEIFSKICSTPFEKKIRKQFSKNNWKVNFRKTCNNIRHAIRPVLHARCYCVVFAGNTGQYYGLRPIEMLIKSVIKSYTVRLG